MPSTQLNMFLAQVLLSLRVLWVQVLLRVLFLLFFHFVVTGTRDPNRFHVIGWSLNGKLVLIAFSVCLVR